MVEVSLTVGKLDASLALLLTKDHHLIEFPTILLPNGVKAGSIVKISCERDLETETEEQRRFLEVQDEILATFGKNLPKAPLLKIKNVTQTSCVLEWDPLDLGTASLKSLTLFKDGKKVGTIPQPLSNRTTKLSGLSIEKSFKVQLKLDSTAGVYNSDLVEVTTHKMTDLSGIQVCLGDITPNDQFTVDDIQQTLVNMGAHSPAQDRVKVDTTHFVTTRENKQNPEFIKAYETNIPIIRPEWLKACEKERRIVGVRDFYVKDCVLPDILAKNYWEKPKSDKSRTESSAEQAPESTNIEDTHGSKELPEDVPELNVSAPSVDTQDLETPQNTPNDSSIKDDGDETNSEFAKIVPNGDAEDVSLAEVSAGVTEENPEPFDLQQNATASEETDITESAATHDETNGEPEESVVEQHALEENGTGSNLDEMEKRNESTDDLPADAQDIATKESALGDDITNGDLAEQNEEEVIEATDEESEKAETEANEAAVVPVAGENGEKKTGVESEQEPSTNVQTGDEQATTGSLDEVSL
ncbi:hypothetical protein HF325_006783 [Metschnikowia pulcherrima]|uniref:Chitin biosynthesis protein CHS5 n=1 Tax=Metschnikowia pulcherrima TaxID=27326 RepID=A0A8H7GNA2_9ASCO|nr:hypothetical protein HF325_006783 [Metschnikowia pulcherrima]